MQNELSVIEYLYRDAGNYKAWGRLLLHGSASQKDEAILRESLDAGEWFVAEQLGIPVLYGELWQLSGGPCRDDHAFHEFHALRRATKAECDELAVWGDMSELMLRFRNAAGRWDCSRSPHGLLPLVA